mmetsp:Transcript_32809/g.50195  ORF Transcript_32809/g.50195 Transcript_32809/m.50195 type:complete len:171 (+) Transcript_32809:26-538(+)
MHLRRKQLSTAMSDERQARLAALAARARRSNKDDDDGNNNNDTVNDQKPSVTFRNYVPHDDSLEKGTVDHDSKKRRGVVNDESFSEKRQKFADDDTSGRSILQAALDQTVKSTKRDVTTTSSFAPRKPNWDLKRDIKGKLDKLERRTQRAIVEMLRRRLEKEVQEENDLD